MSMTSRHPRPRLAAALLALALAVPAAAQTPFAPPVEPIIVGQGYDVPSRALGDPRRVNIMLPAGYGDENNLGVRYPVIYLLDGAAAREFTHIAGLVREGDLAKSSAPAILIGVESNDRKRDLGSASQREAFRRFLVDELKPRVDAAYRTNGLDTLMGASLAGVFVVDTVLRHGADFDRYIAVSPTLDQDDGDLAGRAPRLIASSGQAPRELWLTSGNEGGETQRGIDRLVAALKARTPGNMRWTYAPMPGESHATILHPAAMRALRMLFRPAF